MQGSNDSAARQLAATVGPALLPRSDHASRSFVTARTPQQRNGFDCGVHVLAAATAAAGGCIEGNRTLGLRG
jgi:hypothetical protein